MSRSAATILFFVLTAIAVGCGDVSPPDLSDALGESGDAAPREDAASVDARSDAGADDGGATDSETGDAAGPPPAVSGPPCELPGVSEVVVPAVEAPTSPRFRLRYRVFPSQRAGAPVVVVVPGGPGQALIADDASRAYALGGVPLSAFTIIYTDARGSGCNGYPDVGLPDAEVYNIERVAADLRAIVRSESLSDYYLYGASFGTAVVTVAASQMEAQGETLPHGLVLEGIVGHSFESFESYFGAFEAEWERVSPMLEPPWATDFATEPWPASLRWTRAQWGTFISAQLILGDLPTQGHILGYWLRGLTQMSPSAVSYVTDYMASVPPDGFAGASRMFRSIACRELWGGWRSGREIRDGALHATGSEVCSGEPRRFYDSAAFLSSVPVTYFHGPFDPTTTTEQAEYHFDAHRGAPRDFVTVPLAAHAPLTLGLAARGCISEVWGAIAGERALSQVLVGCEQPGESIELRSRQD